jgi:CubicO group peptidase (beta-lactamase class C family)
MTRSLLLLAAALFADPALAQGLGRGTPDAPATEWDTADPDTMGMSLAVLDAHLGLCQRSRADGCLVAYRGHVVQEWTAPGYAERPLEQTSLASAGKAYVALLAGMIAAETDLSIDGPVAEWLPEWQAGADSAVTVRHLLTHTSGLPRLRGCPPDVADCQDDWTAYVTTLELAHAPGTRFVYSNEGAQLLSPILERAAGVPLHEYARDRLFQPLGLDSTRLAADAAGTTITYGGPYTTLREAAAVGQLVANGGAWNGRQIVPAEWVGAVGTPAETSPFHGLLWWTDPAAGAVWAAGSFDNLVIVYPEQDLVVVRLGSMPDDGDAPPEVGYYAPSTFHLLRGLLENRLPPRTAG